MGAFRDTQGGVPTGIVLRSCRNLKGNFTMSGALYVPQMKEEDVLKFLATGARLGGTHPDFRYIYKRKGDEWYLHHKSEENLGEKLPLAAHAVVAIENPAGISVTSSRSPDQRAVLKCAAGATPVAGRFALEPSPSRSGKPPQSHVMLGLYFYRDREDMEKQAQAAAEKVVTKEDFRGKWTAPAPEFTATPPEVADWSAGVLVRSGPTQQFPAEDWGAQPPPKTGLRLPLLRPLNG
ncbi:40S ribosomal protein SA-like [Felis catus]|uniref:40S ribosomal protein SA-like n=1 Tax=Felis catus TaxID=9685 RepID=UPI001D1A1CD0|nr:40S ribosomal protein SA-like [Felis catus]